MLLWPFLDGGCVCSRLLIYHCEPGDGDQLLWGLSSFAVLWPESSWLVCLCVVLLIFQSLTKGRVKCCKSTLETITEHDKLFLIPLRSIRGLELSTSDVYQKFDVSHIYSMKVKDVYTLGWLAFTSGFAHIMTRPQIWGGLSKLIWECSWGEIISQFPRISQYSYILARYSNWIALTEERISRGQFWLFGSDILYRRPSSLSLTGMNLRGWLTVPSTMRIEVQRFSFVDFGATNCHSYTEVLTISLSLWRTNCGVWPNICWRSTPNLAKCQVFWICRMIYLFQNLGSQFINQPRPSISGES